MDAKEILDDIRRALRQIGDRKVVGIDALDQYLSDLERDASESAENRLARFKAQHESNLAEYQAKVAAGLEKLRTTVEAGHQAMRTASIINGGAAVSLLAFLGSIWTAAGSSTPDVAQIPAAMLLFVGGVLLSAVARGTAYLSMYFSSPDSDRLFHIYNRISISLIIGSYATFVIGGILAYASFVP